MAVRYSKSIDLLTGTDPAEASVGVTVDTTGPTVDVSLVQLKSIQFRVSNHTTGNTVFTIEISNDGVTWTAYNRLIPNLTGTNSQTDAHVASVTVSDNVGTFAFFPVGDYFRYIRAKSDVTTDGTSYAYLEAV